jgi:hypothetical protein
MIAIPLPQLTPEEKAALDSFDYTEYFHEKIEPLLPPEKHRPWRVTDRWGRVLKRHATREEAMDDARARNKRAREWGIDMRYRVGR